MRKGLSLNVRLTCLVGVMLAAIVGIISATLWVTNAQKADGVIINVAGRQRMLVQRMIKAVLAYAIDSREQARPAGRRNDRYPVISGDLTHRCAITTTDEVGQLSHRLNQAIDAMVRMMEDIKAAAFAKSEFLANMSHEIRSPMTAILGYVDLVKEGCLNKCPFGRGEFGDHIEIISQNAHHLLQILDDILDLSKIEAGKLEVERVACSPAEVMAEVASLMRVRADGKNLSLELEYAGPIPEHIQSDPARLRQILLNLVGNAIKFTEMGSVRLVARLVQADEKRPQLQFDVIDTGIGMTQKQLAGIFQPFVQADTSTSRQFGGSGLGLTISERLAEPLGGDVTVTSSPGKGSTFSVTVDTGPLDGVRMVDPSSEPTPQAKQTVKPSAAGKIKLDCRVLLVEDGADIQGYQGSIIALTAHAMKEDRQKCLDAGCDDYISKPIDREKLLETVARYARGPAERSHAGTATRPSTRASRRPVED